MPDPLPREEFIHFHRDGLKNLEIDRARLVAEGRVSELATLDTELIETLNQVFKKLSDAGRTDPEQVFREAIGALDNLDAKRFLIENLLEALKRGEGLKETLERYKNLGLIRVAPSPNITNPNLASVGKGLVTRKSLWRRVTTAVVQIAVNAFKSIPKWIEIEPQITFIGPIPAVSFTLKGKGMNIQELFETLRGAEEQSVPEDT